MDLLFCTNQNTILNNEVDVAVSGKCRHNIFFCKINIRVLLTPVYVGEVWVYSPANVENNNNATSNFNWRKAFENLFVNAKVKYLTDTLLNIFWNYVPSKKIKSDCAHLLG